MRIKEIAESQNLSLAQLARDVEISDKHMYAVANGHQDCTSKILKRIADRLGVKTDDLFDPVQEPAVKAK